MNAIAPDQINPLDLPFVPLKQRNDLPETPAVYFVISEEAEILYIGQAINLRNRWITAEQVTSPSLATDGAGYISRIPVVLPRKRAGRSSLINHANGLGVKQFSNST